MTLRTATITIEREGRDKGKQFYLTEMPSAQAEDWFMRAIMLLARSGAELPPGIFEHGAPAFAAMGIGSILTGLGKSAWFDVKPLLDEMMTCVGFISPNGSIISTPSLVSSQIEEVHTRIQLREEVLSLHLGFSLAAKLLEMHQIALALLTLSSSNTSTSPETLQ